jgi:hypothetical protein
MLHEMARRQRVTASAVAFGLDLLAYAMYVLWQRRQPTPDEELGRIAGATRDTIGWQRRSASKSRWSSLAEQRSLARGLGLLEDLLPRGIDPRSPRLRWAPPVAHDACPAAWAMLYQLTPTRAITSWPGGNGDLFGLHRARRLTARSFYGMQSAATGGLRGVVEAADRRCG